MEISFVHVHSPKLAYWTKTNFDMKDFPLSLALKEVKRNSETVYLKLAAFCCHTFHVWRNCTSRCRWQRCEHLPHPYHDVPTRRFSRGSFWGKETQLRWLGPKVLGCQTFKWPRLNMDPNGVYRRWQRVYGRFKSGQLVDEVTNKVFVVYSFCAHECKYHTTYLIRSDDFGFTWTKPLNLSSQIGTKMFAPGPGFGIQVSGT